MDKKKFLKILLLCAVLGFILGIIPGFYEVSIPWYIPFAIFAVALLTSIFIGIRKSTYPLDLMNQGRFDEAINLFSKLHEKSRGRFGYKGQALSSIANCFNRMGRFEESISYLDMIDDKTSDRNLKAVNYAIYAHNLYFLGRNFEKAKKLALKSRELYDMPETILTQALIELETEGRAAACRTISEYYNFNFDKKYIPGFSTVLIIDEFSRQVCENFMLGLYCYKTGDRLKAQRHFSEAVKCNYENYFSISAKQILKEMKE